MIECAWGKKQGRKKATLGRLRKTAFKIDGKGGQIVSKSYNVA